MTRTESTVCWLGWGILALVGMYGCTGGTARADEIVAPAVETPNLVVETPDLAGTWQSSIGLDYEFTQDGPDFAWRVNGSGQLGMGTVAGSLLNASWRVDGRQVRGRGEIVERVEGNPSRIRWNNGVEFFRDPPREAEPEGDDFGGVEPRGPSYDEPRDVDDEEFVYDLSGRWVSNLGHVYRFRQEGDRFTWKVDGLRQDGRGRIRNELLDASWNVGRGLGMSAGEVTEADGGYALRIEWANGVIFTRQAQ